MAITAAQVKELRERTGSGMMECKKALVDAGGDMDAAIEMLRKTGLAKADKKAGRVAAEGLIAVGVSEDGRSATLVEVNCETDFVAKKAEFQEFANAIAQRILAGKPADIEALLAMPLHDGEETSIELARKSLIASIGENINVRRFDRLDATQGILAHYQHGVRIGVLVELQGGDAELARDIAMHIAASKPQCVDRGGRAAVRSLRRSARSSPHRQKPAASRRISSKRWWTDVSGNSLPRSPWWVSPSSRIPTRPSGSC